MQSAFLARAVSKATAVILAAALFLQPLSALAALQSYDHIQRAPIFGASPKALSSYSSNSDSGAFVYGIDIEVPKGVAELTPELMLQYNHTDRSKDSHISMGWSLGVPVIEREKHSRD